MKKIKYCNCRKQTNFKSEFVPMLPVIKYNSGEHNKEKIPRGFFSKVEAATPVVDIHKDLLMYLCAENDMAPIINKTSKEYISMHSEASQLDLFDEQSVMYKKADVLDFTQFDEEDILKSVMEKLNDSDVKKRG